MFEKEYMFYIKDVSFTSKKFISAKNNKASGKSKTRAHSSRVARRATSFVNGPTKFLQLRLETVFHKTFFTLKHSTISG